MFSLWKLAALDIVLIMGQDEVAGGSWGKAINSEMVASLTFLTLWILSCQTST